MSARGRTGPAHGAFLAIALAIGLSLGLLTAVSAAAAGSVASWNLHAVALPTNLQHPSAGEEAECAKSVGNTTVNCPAYLVTAANVGAKATSGAITFEDTVPAGLEVLAVRLFLRDPTKVPAESLLPPADCAAAANQITCHYAGALAPEHGLALRVYVRVAAGAEGVLVDTARISGGAPEATTQSEALVAQQPAPFGPTALQMLISNADGTPALQAGAHPYEFGARIDLATRLGIGPDAQYGINSVEDPRDAVVDLPLGFLGTALATPRCTFAELARGVTAGVGGCPTDTIVGYLYTEPVNSDSTEGPIYNMVPERGGPAEFGFVDVVGGSHVLAASVVPGPQGYVLRTTSRELPQTQLTDIITTFYGDPAARNGGAEEGQPQVPLFTNPADCSGKALVTSVHMDSWQHPGAWLPDGEPDLSDPNWKTSAADSPPVTGCEELSGLFRPTLEAKTDTSQGDSPAGFEVTIKVPHEEEPEALAAPPLKKAVVTLPEGMSVNASSANGLKGCSLAEIGVSTGGTPDGEPVRCPAGSKIGSLELASPDLPGTLQGEIYVAKQSENPFGSLLAIYLVIDDPTTGVLVKIPGEIRADESTGQLQAVVDNSPQFPFSELKTRFFGGSLAALRTPAVCGKYTVNAQLTPWSAPQSGPPTSVSGSFRVSEGCAETAAEEPNAPSFEAGTENPLAGAFSPFVLKLRREDASQELNGLAVTLPEGLLAKLAGVGECPESGLALARSREREGGGAEELASPSCPQSSEVGTVTVGAGAGPTPFYATGHAYLAGPYKGAPLSLAIITPALAGPYDLGDVLVRSALRVDPYTAQVTAVSDEIPHILHGIPLDVRSISLQMSRSQFTLNPTNCEATQVTGSASTVLGQSAPLANRFQVGGCKSLKFKPKLSLSLKGRTTRAGHPALRAVLTYPKKGAYANVASAQVGLSHSELLDQGNLNNVCTQPELASRSCPASSVYGRAKAWSPLLEKPLEGNVYLGVGFGHKLPDLVAELNGQIRVLLHAQVDTDKQQGLRTTFKVVPDAPVEKFVLEMKGGKRYGLLTNSENVCSKPERAAVKLIAQSGIVDQFQAPIAYGCKGQGKGHKRHGKGKGGRRPAVGGLLGGW